MAFENLSDKLQNVFKQLRGKGKLTEKDVKDAMREVKLALLEADVNFKIVKDFVKTVTERAIGSDVLESLTPGQQVIKIVNEELIALMGSTQSKITFAPHPPTVYMMVGLQGAGKTTTSGKLAGLLRKQGKSPLLVACDIYRPAAIKQLQVVGKTYDIPVFEMGDKKSPVEISKEALKFAEKNRHDVILIDTAGRLHINEELMDELKEIKSTVRPQEILLVVDAMTGQDAVTVAQSFDEQLGIDGIILTKLDGDTRGGAAISVRSVTNKPIKYIGMGEKLEDLEPFYPDRMASRILGMGDVLSLIEKAQQNFDEKEAMELQRKMRQNEFDFNDFLSQMQQIKKMGPLKDLLGMIPGMGQQLGNVDIDPKAMAHLEAIIQSMTKEERENPSILNGPRKKRIAMGSGRTIAEVNRLVKQFDELKKIMKQFSGGSSKGLKGMKGMMGLGKAMKMPPFFK
ncbi:MAG: signal recognition particle protein [Clostridiales bacterium]|nr:signal recognition particle protein [Clostridiales bacterium]